MTPRMRKRPTSGALTGTGAQLARTQQVVIMTLLGCAFRALGGLAEGK